MISVMRSQLKNGGMSFIIWVAVISMVAGYIVPLFFKQKGTTGPWAIMVNGEPIPYKTFNTELAMAREYIAMLRAQYGQFADYILQSSGMADPQAMTFRSLVGQTLMNQNLHQIGLQPHHAYIAHKMADESFVQQYASDIIPPHSIAADGSINSKIVRAYLQRRGMSMHEFEQKIAQKVGSWFLLHTVNLFAYTPDYLIAHTAAQQKSKKGFSYITISYKDFVSDMQHQEITKEELHDFFQQENKRIKRYEIPEKRSGAQWEFSPDTYGAVVDDRDIQAYYEQHKGKDYVASPTTIQVRQIVLQVHAADRNQIYNKAQELHARLVINQNMFAEVARTESDDKATASNGGLVDPFARGTQDPLFERTAFTLQEDGALSAIIELPDRYVIMQRVHKEPQTYKPLKDVRGEIEKTMRADSFKAAFTQAVDSYIHMGKDEQKVALEAYIKEHRGNQKQITNIAQTNTPQAKALYTLKVGDYGMYLQGDRGYIVQLDTIEPLHTPHLEAIENKVRDDIIDKRARAQFTKESDRVYGLVVKEGIEKAAQQEQLKVHTITPYSAQDADRIKDMQAKGLDPVGYLKLEHVGSVTSSEQHDILHIVQCTSFEQEGVDAIGVDQATTSTKEQEISRFSDAYIASLYRDATIETNDIVDIQEEENSI